MRKQTKIILLLILTTCLIFTAFACSGGGDEQVDYKNIERIEVSEESLGDGFLLSEFKITDIKITVFYKGTIDEEGNEVEGSTTEIDMQESYILAEDKAYLSTVGTHSIHFVYGKFSSQFDLTLTDNTVVNHTLTFITAEDSIVDVINNIEDGSSLTRLPHAPQKENYTFLGWYEEKASVEFDFSEITKSCTLYARYEKNVIKVEYYTKVNKTTGAPEETLISTVQIKNGGSALVDAPEFPSIAGYSNPRWESEEDMTTVVEDSKFYIIYDRDKVKVTLRYYKNGESYDDEEKMYDVNSSIIKTSDATIVGYKFVGWYCNDRKVQLPYVVTNEITLVAKYLSLSTDVAEYKNGLIIGEGGMVYDIVNDESRIVDFVGKDEVGVIPQSVFYQNTDYKITSIENEVFKGAKISEFVVNNSNFSDVGGVLYSKDKTTLYAYPIADSITKKFVLPAETTKILDSAFYGASYLEELDLKTNNTALKNIGKYAFANCENLSKVSFNTGVSEIEDLAFSGAISLKNIDLISSVNLSKIGSRAFYNCVALNTITLPASLTSIGSAITENCISLKEITIDSRSSEFRMIDGGLYDTAGEELYSYPANPLNLNSTDISLPSTLKTIKSGAFSFTRVNCIIFNSSVTLENNSIVSPNIQYLKINNGDNSLIITNIDNLSVYTDSITDEIFMPAVFDETSDQVFFYKGYIYKTKELIDPSTQESYLEAIIIGFNESYVNNDTENFAIEDGVLNIIDTISVNSDTSYGVSEIGEKAFYGIASINEITLPIGITSIGERAFACMQNLEKVTLNEKLENISDLAFYNSSKLKTVNFSDDMEIKNIGIDVFGGTKYIMAPNSGEFLTINNLLVKYYGTSTEVKIPTEIKYIGSEAFLGNNNILSIDFNIDKKENNLLSKIGVNAFSQCNSLTEIYLPQTVVSYGEGAFSNCSNLVRVVLSVNSDSDIFDDISISNIFGDTATIEYSNDNLTELVYHFGDDSKTYNALTFVNPLEELSDFVYYEGWYSDAECTNLVEFPYSPIRNAELGPDDKFRVELYSKEISLKDGSENIEYRKVEQGYEVYKFEPEDGQISLVIPKYYNGEPVVGVASNLLSSENGRKVQNIILPRENNSTWDSNLLYIGENAFNESKWFENYTGINVIINDFLLAYRGSELQVNVPSEVAKFADGAFSDKTLIEDVVIPDSIISISENLFKNCQSLKSVVLGSNVKYVEKNAFENCVSLNSINFIDLKNLQFIDSTAFDGTNYLSEYIDDCLIINGILYQYRGTSDVLHIPSGVKYIADKAFYDNDYIKNIYIPASVKEIGVSAFEGCDVLQYVNIFETGSELEYIKDRAFAEASSLVKISIEYCNKLRELGAESFIRTISLNSINIPSSVEFIGEEAFLESGVKSVVFGKESNLRLLSSKTFMDCVYLSKINFGSGSKLVTIGESVFENCIVLRTFDNKDAPITAFEKRAFYGCTELTNMVFDVTKLANIGDNAIKNLGYIANKSDAMLIMGSILVSYSGAQEEVVIPYNIKTIYNQAFINNAYVKSIVISGEGEARLENINDEAFRGCKNLENIEFPNTVKYVGNDVMTDTKWLREKENAQEEFIIVANSLIDYNGRNNFSSVIIPNDVNAINANTFDGENVISIIVNESIKRIEEGAFSGIKTKEVDYYTYDYNTNSFVSTKNNGWTLTMLGENPIEIYESIPTGNIDEGLREIFVNNKEIYTLDSSWREYFYIISDISNRKVELRGISDETKVETDIIYDESHLEKLYYNAMGKEFASDKVDDVFFNWSINKDNDTSLIMEYPLSLSNFSEHQELVLVANYINLDNNDGANKGAYWIEEDKIIGYDSTTKSQKVIVPASGNASSESALFYKGIACGYIQVEDGKGDYINVSGEFVASENGNYKMTQGFKNNTDITEVYFANGSQIEYLDAGVFENCTNLRKIVLPYTMKTIKTGAFKNCTNLEEIIFTSPDSSDIKLNIEEKAFENCDSLISITLNSNVESLGHGCFYNCQSLTSVTLLTNAPPMLTGTSYELPFGDNENLTIFVLREQVYNYQNAWTGYINNIEGIKK